MKRDLPYSFLTTLLKFAVNLYEQRESVRPTKMKHLSRGRFPEWKRPKKFCFLNHRNHRNSAEFIFAPKIVSAEISAQKYLASPVKSSVTRLGNF